MTPRDATPGGADALSPLALNRATLARQMLLRRWEVGAEEAVRHLAGMQAQAPNPPYVGLWTRLAGFAADDLSRAIVERRLVRIALLRSTIHLVTADDCLAMRPALQPVLDRGLQGVHGRGLAGLDLDAVVAAGREMVEAEPRTLHDVGARLRERWPERDADALAAVVRTRVPLVQVPPRGLWGVPGQAAHTSAEAWLGRPLSAPMPAEEMVLRYLAAYGPATVKDVQTWCGLTRMRDAVERLRPRLRAFRGEDGAELWDLPDAPRPDAHTPAPPRFLPEWDNLLLSYADRTRVLSPAARARVFTQNGIIRATVLVDGEVRGAWRVERARGGATLVVEPFARLAAADRRALGDEGARVLAFVAPDARGHDVRFEPVAS